jgi:hypothetical protein
MTDLCGWNSRPCIVPGTCWSPRPNGIGTDATVFLSAVTSYGGGTRAQIPTARLPITNSGYRGLKQRTGRDGAYHMRALAGVIDQPGVAPLSAIDQPAAPAYGHSVRSELAIKGLRSAEARGGVAPPSRGIPAYHATNARLMAQPFVVMANGHYGNSAASSIRLSDTKHCDLRPCRSPRAKKVLDRSEDAKTS